MSTNLCALRSAFLFDLRLRINGIVIHRSAICRASHDFRKRSKGGIECVDRERGGATNDDHATDRVVGFEVVLLPSNLRPTTGQTGPIGDRNADPNLPHSFVDDR